MVGVLCVCMMREKKLKKQKKLTAAGRRWCVCIENNAVSMSRSFRGTFIEI